MTVQFKQGDVVLVAPDQTPDGIPFHHVKITFPLDGVTDTNETKMVDALPCDEEGESIEEGTWCGKPYGTDSFIGVVRSEEF